MMLTVNWNCYHYY